MKNYREFPPVNYLMRILKNCPESALLYIELWEKRGKKMSLNLSRTDIRKEFLISPTLFRNMLMSLKILNIIRYVEKDEHFQIDILGPQVNED